MTKRIQELESIRGIAALLVVFDHIPYWHPSVYPTVARCGILMVDLFFVLSGFLIYRIYGMRLQTGGDLLRFQFLRFGRLYPVHLVFLLVFAAIEWAKYYAARNGFSLPNARPFEFNNWNAFVEHLFLTQAFGSQFSSFNSAAWSISVEFYIYLLFALIAVALGRRQNFAFVSIAGVSMLIMVFFPGATSPVARGLGGFFTGCCVAMVPTEQRRSPWCLAAAITSLLAFLGLVSDPRYDSAIYPLSALLIFSIVACRESVIQRWLRWRVPVFLGLISYSLYMAHGAVIWFGNQFIRLILHRPDVLVSGKMTPQVYGIEAAAAVLLIVAASVLVSHLTYHFVEKPFRQRSRSVVGLSQESP